MNYVNLRLHPELHRRSVAYRNAFGDLIDALGTNNIAGAENARKRLDEVWSFYCTNAFGKAFSMSGFARDALLTTRHKEIVSNSDPRMCTVFVATPDDADKIIGRLDEAFGKVEGKKDYVLAFFLRGNAVMVSAKRKGKE